MIEAKSKRIDDAIKAGHLGIVTTKRGGAKSVTLPITKSNNVTGQVTIQADKFGAVQAEIDAIRQGQGNNKTKSDASWDVLKKHGTRK